MQNSRFCQALLFDFNIGAGAATWAASNVKSCPVDERFLLHTHKIIMMILKDTRKILIMIVKKFAAWYKIACNYYLRKKGTVQK
jgi:hypothetical protein